LKLEHALAALAAFVEKRGFSTASATCSKDAQRELDRQRFDVVLLDVFLPDGSGLDLLLSIPKQRRPQVVLMTGDEDEVVADLSEPVRAALDDGVRLVVSLLEDLTTTEEELT